MLLGRHWYVQKKNYTGIYFFIMINQHCLTIFRAKMTTWISSWFTRRRTWITFSTWNCHLPIIYLAQLVVKVTLHSDVWIVLGRIGGARCASLNNINLIPSIGPNSGKMDHSKMYPCATWTMLSALDTQRQVHHVWTMEICSQIDGWLWSMSMEYSSTTSGSANATVQFQNTNSFSCRNCFLPPLIDRRPRSLWMS